MRVPEPKERPLSRQLEIACASTMGTGALLLVGAQVTEGELSRQLFIGAIACIVTVGPPVAYQVTQAIRWVRRTQA